MNMLAQSVGKFSACLVMAFCLSPAFAQEATPAKPIVFLDEVVEGMPVSSTQEIRVLTATFAPRQRTVFHTHRFPVTVYVLDGEFGLDVEGQAPARQAAGTTFVEPPNARMTGYNTSSDRPLSVLIFYVSDPETPFLDPIM